MKKIEIFGVGGKLHWVRNLYQRFRYGAGCCDLYSLDWYLAKKIIKPLKRFKGVYKGGYPMGMTEKKWKKIIDEMIWAFEFYLKDEMGGTPEDYKREQKGFELFGKYFRDLWY